MKTYVGTIDQGDSTVTVNGQPLSPRFDLYNHSPTGFAWGYEGSGPAQLALAILAHCAGEKLALMHYQDFKRRVITPLDKDKGFTLTSDEVDDHLDAIIAGSLCGRRAP